MISLRFFCLFSFFSLHITYSAVSVSSKVPTAKSVVDFHHQVIAHARRTIKTLREIFS